MKLTVFGIGSASPQLDKHPSSFLLSINNEYVLIDCGEGTQYRLLENKIKRRRLKTICISHLHGDHYFGLIGLLSSLNLNRRTEPMTIIGPPGLKEILDIQFAHSNATQSFELKFIETQNAEDALVFENKLFTIKSFPLIHRVPCTGFLVTEKTEARHIIGEKLAKSFPIPFIKQLKAGKDVTDPITGDVYKANDYTRKGETPAVFAYCSDTAYNPSMIPTIKGANLIYHEATFLRDLEDKAEKTQHSTAEQAAKIAKEAGVKKMLLGHFSSRYKEDEAHLSEARLIFKNVEIAAEGQVYDII